jgi:hypothetical protein
MRDLGWLDSKQKVEGPMGHYQLKAEVIGVGGVRLEIE